MTNIITYPKPKGITISQLQMDVDYIKKNNPNWGKKYKVIVSYYCQGDFCRRYYERVEINKKRIKL